MQQLCCQIGTKNKFWFSIICYRRWPWFSARHHPQLIWTTVYFLNIISEYPKGEKCHRSLLLSRGNINEPELNIQLLQYWYLIFFFSIDFKHLFAQTSGSQSESLPLLKAMEILPIYIPGPGFLNLRYQSCSGISTFYFIAYLFSLWLPGYLSVYGSVHLLQQKSIRINTFAVQFVVPAAAESHCYLHL